MVSWAFADPMLFGKQKFTRTMNMVNAEPTTAESALISPCATQKTQTNRSATRAKATSIWSQKLARSRSCSFWILESSILGLVVITARCGR